ncbi:MAG: hypothetical protein ACO1NU_09185 [Arcticibacter sp.]
MMPLELKNADLLFESVNDVNLLPQRSLEFIKEKHLEQQRIPANLSIAQAIWTAFVATCCCLQSLFHK